MPLTDARAQHHGRQPAQGVRYRQPSGPRVVVTWVPERGQAIWIDMRPQAGHEQTGRRPALVLSPGTYSGKTGLALLCPITSQVKGTPFEVRLPEGLEVRGAVLSDQVKSLDWKVRNATLIRALPNEVVEAVSMKLNAFFRFDFPALNRFAFSPIGDTIKE